MCVCVCMYMYMYVFKQMETLNVFHSSASLFIKDYKNSNSRRNYSGIIK